MATTPRSKRKRPQQNSPGDSNATICPICLDPIIDATTDAEGQEAIYCESICDAWIHRQCAGPSKTLYEVYQNGDDPFYCPHCRLAIQEQKLHELKSTIDSLKKEVTDLKADKPQPKETVNTTQHIISEPHPITSEPPTSGSQSTSFNNKVPDKSQEDRKFNVVIYGVKECTKGTPRHERLNHDLDKVTSIVTEGDNSISPLSIRDLLRLGKYREESSKPRPILVKLNRTIDVSLLLSKAKSLQKDIRIKPDLTREERMIESLLLKERWTLIQSGVERKVIKIRSNKIYVKNKLHGQVTNSSFVPNQPQSSETEMDSSNA